MGDPLKAHVYFRLENPAESVHAGLGFDDLLGQRIFTAHSLFQPDHQKGEWVGDHTFVCEIPSLILVPGQYKIKVSLDIGNSDVDLVNDAVRINIIESDYYGTGKVPWSGLFVLKHQWYLK